jgi:hypothetical protein
MIKSFQPLEVEMADFMTYFSALPYPRIERCKKHKLLDILFLTVSAVLSGAQGWEAIEDFGHAKLPWLKRFIKLPSGFPAMIPSQGLWVGWSRLSCSNVSLNG